MFRSAALPSGEDSVLEQAPLRCASCGSPAEAGASHCAACGAAISGAEAPADPDAPSPLTMAFECRSCAATVACAPGRGSSVCAFCGSTYVVEVPAAGLAGLVPEFVIPFRVGRERAEAIFGHWCRGGLFTPGDVRRAGRMDRLQGIYLPFWTFSMRADSTWQADIGEYWWETKRTSKGTRRVRRTEWHPLSGRHHSYHYHHLVSGSKGLPQDEALEVFPFEILAMRRYRPELLAGWLAEPFSVSREQALALCQQHFREIEGQRIAAFLPGDTSKGLEWSTTFSEKSDDLLLLPFWIGTYTYQDKPYRFVLNGQTGRATGTRPKSLWKIAAAILAVLAILLAVAWFLSSVTSP
jgi:hypothetical protein